MEWYEAIILGLVQGLTEFLPVSSSGHLAIGKELLGIEKSEDLVLELVLHAATVLSTIVVFRKQIWNLLKSLFEKDGFFRTRPVNYNEGTDYILKILVSMIPIFIVGVFFKDFVESLFGSISFVASALLLTALLLFLSDKLSWKSSETVRRNGISYWQAFVIGVGQSLAVIPGLSRSGTTIATGLLTGVKRDVVAQFSFLMVLVPILGETFLEIVSGEIMSSSISFLPLFLGFISAFVSGLAACKIMIALVRRAKLSWFALYCAIVAILIFIFA